MSPDPTTAPAAVFVTPANDDMPAWAIRLEGKVDLVVAQQTQRLDNHAEDIADHERRLRHVEGELPRDAEARLREVEERETISPGQLWTAVVGGITAATAVAGVLISLYH